MTTTFTIKLKPPLFGGIPFLDEKKARLVPGILREAFSGSVVRPREMLARIFCSEEDCILTLETEKPEMVEKIFADSEQATGLFQKAGWELHELSAAYDSSKYELEISVPMG